MTKDGSRHHGPACWSFRTPLVPRGSSCPANDRRQNGRHLSFPCPLVGWIQPTQIPRLRIRRAYTRNEKPPLGYGGAEAGHDAVDRLILQIEVQAVGAVEDGTRDVWGWARRGDGDCRRIGNGDAGRYVADVSRRDGGQGHLSLKAAFVGERSARLHASKR